MDKNNTDMGVSLVLLVAAAVGIMMTTSGCGMLGVREADLWGAKFTFAEGLDFHLGANQIDNVDDRRGVTPIKGQGRRSAEKY